MYSQRTPLYSAFFNQSNVDKINRNIREIVNEKTGVTINEQNQNDLFNLMQSVYSVNNMSQTESIADQVDWMNSIIIRKAAQQVVSGIMMNVQYQMDIQKLPTPSDLPVNVSQYGKKISTDSIPGW
jgi:hypothetical protein